MGQNSKVGRQSGRRHSGLTPCIPLQSGRGLAETVRHRQHLTGAIPRPASNGYGVGSCCYGNKMTPAVASAARVFFSRLRPIVDRCSCCGGGGSAATLTICPLYTHSRVPADPGARPADICDITPAVLGTSAAGGKPAGRKTTACLSMRLVVATSSCQWSSGVFDLRKVWLTCVGLKGCSRV